MDRWRANTFSTEECAVSASVTTLPRLVYEAKDALFEFRRVSTTARVFELGRPLRISGSNRRNAESAARIAAALPSDGRPRFVAMSCIVS
jgi:hypothetical protein